MNYSHNTKSGVPVRVRKVIYTGHASTIYSVDSACRILDQIGQRTGSEDILPFALKLVEGDDCIEIAEDNNEFACGEALARCLDKYEGYNIMVCVSRHVEGCYVSDMIQQYKIQAVKEAATSALELLFGELKSRSSESANNNSNKLVNEICAPHRSNSEASHPFHLVDQFSRSTSGPVILDPFLNPTSPLAVTKNEKSRRGKPSKLQSTLSATR